jgi:2-haloacid dehalogenase
MTAQFALFDLGGVVLDWSPDRLYSKLIPDASQRADFLNKVCTMEWHGRHDAGVSFADNAAQLIKRYPQHEALIRAWSARFMEMFDGYVAGTARLIDHLVGAGVPTYALSNVPDEIFGDILKAFPLLERFRETFVSGRLGLIKPEPKLFNYALARMGDPDPGDVLFIDDAERNIRAAHALGFRTHHFHSAESLEFQLVRERLL